MLKHLSLVVLFALAAPIASAEQYDMYAMVGAGSSEYLSWGGDNRDSTTALGFGGYISDNIAMELSLASYGANAGSSSGQYADYDATTVGFAFVFKKPQLIGNYVHLFAKWGFESWAINGEIQRSSDSTVHSVDDHAVTIWGGVGAGMTFNRFDLNLIHEWHKWSIDVGDLQKDQSLKNISLQLMVNF